MDNRPTEAEKKNIADDEALSRQRDLDETALDWVIKLTSGDASQSDIDACRQWRAKSAQHESAFVDAKALWHELAQLNHESQNAHVLTQPSILNSGHAYAFIQNNPVFHFLFHSSYRYVIYLFIALSIVMTSYLSNMNKKLYVTDFGEISTFNLSEDSKVTLNTNTVIDIGLLKDKKEIEIKQGEAYFDIGDDQDLSPLYINADKRIMAESNTAFSVEKTSQGTKVTVIHGQVRIFDGNQYLRTLEANQQLVSYGYNNLYVAYINPDYALSWRDKKLHFVSMPLINVLTEISRYDSRKWLFLLDESTQNKMINATINIDSTKNKEEWLDALSKSFHVQIKYVGPLVIIYH